MVGVCPYVQKNPVVILTDVVRREPRRTAPPSTVKVVLLTRKGPTECIKGVCKVL